MLVLRDAIVSVVAIAYSILQFSEEEEESKKEEDEKALWLYAYTQDWSWLDMIHTNKGERAKKIVWAEGPSWR